MRPQKRTPDPCPSCGSIRPEAPGWVPVYGTAARPGHFEPCTSAFHS